MSRVVLWEVSHGTRREHPESQKTCRVLDWPSSLRSLGNDLRKIIIGD